MFLYFFVIITLFAAISIIISTVKYGIPPMPTSLKVKKALMEHLPKEVPGQIAELGAGWGTLAFALAKKYPSSTVVAYETSFIPFLFLCVRRSFSKTSNLTIRFKDFYKEDLSSFSLIVCYLYPGAMRQLGSKLNTELSPSTKIITHTFSLPDWTAIESWEVNDLYRTVIYYYEK